MRERNETSIRHCPNPCNEKIACLPIESKEKDKGKNFLDPLKVNASQEVKKYGFELCYSVYNKSNSVIKNYYEHDREWPFFKDYHSKFFIIDNKTEVTLFDKQVFCMCKFGYKEISQYKRTVCFPDEKIQATKGCKRPDKGDGIDDGCGLGGKCQMVNDKPECVCHASYTGKFCETKIDICSEIEKPSHQFHNLKCQYGQCQHFVQSRFGFRCICNGKDGMITRRTAGNAWNLNPSCEDVNECQPEETCEKNGLNCSGTSSTDGRDSPTCSYQGVCINTISSFNCSCNPDYSGRTCNRYTGVIPQWSSWESTDECWIPADKDCFNPGDRFSEKQIRRLICRKKSEMGSHPCTRKELEEGPETKGNYIDLVQYKQNKNIDCSAFNQLPRCSNVVNSGRYDPELIRKHIRNVLNGMNSEVDLKNLTDLPEDVYDPFIEGPIRH
ncbi:DgyrCDS9920 [Dimorphilus gyrociliatus]|nr:DgyrCDS9920 [Dimorphilus gyrociliatus]